MLMIILVTLTSNETEKDISIYVDFMQNMILFKHCCLLWTLFQCITPCLHYHPNANMVYFIRIAKYPFAPKCKFT